MSGEEECPTLGRKFVPLKYPQGWRNVNVPRKIGFCVAMFLVEAEYTIIYYGNIEYNINTYIIYVYM